MGMYATPISYHDIEDVEDLCTRVARRYASNHIGEITDSDFDSLVSYLVVAVWRMAERYDPERASSFAAVVRGRLPNRCVDWRRAHWGRTRWQFGDHKYERPFERTVSLDAPAHDDGGSLAEFVGAVDGDLEASTGASAFGGLLEGRDSEAPWDSAVVRALARRLLRERSEHARAA